jgi:hypothetical protein
VTGRAYQLVAGRAELCAFVGLARRRLVSQPALYAEARQVLRTEIAQPVTDGHAWHWLYLREGERVGARHHEAVRAAAEGEQR